MLRAIILTCALLLTLAPLTGCTPEIGDGCKNSIDCSQQGDRLCDTTQPAGYCTIFNCEPDTCPEDEAACVAFDHQLDPACQSVDYAGWARFQRTFCMKLCDDDSDCRGDVNGDSKADYECVLPGDRRALIVDTMLESTQKVCLATSDSGVSSGVAGSDGAGGAAGLPVICDPDGGGMLPAPYQPDAGTDGGGGAGGT